MDSVSGLSLCPFWRNGGGDVKWKLGWMNTKGMEIDEEKMVHDTLTRAERMVSGFEGI